MKVDFSKIELHDIDGKKQNIEIHKTIGRIIYMFTENLDLIEIAQKIHKGEEVELRDSDVSEIKRLFKRKEGGLLAYVRKTVEEYMDKQKGAK